MHYGSKTTDINFKVPNKNFLSFIKVYYKKKKKENTVSTK